MKPNFDFRLLSSVCILSFLLEYEVAAYTAVPRWGQAVAVLNDCLFVHGGKTDEYNSYSYRQAPANSDLLYLSLSSSFNLTSPPWELISSASETSTSQGPAVAWHTLSGLNSSSMLLFGGLPATNSATVLINRADSSWMLDVYALSEPNWEQEVLAWAGQPTRRIHHSTITSTSGQVYIIGGEMADGSEVALTEHYVFDPDSQSFTQLPSTNGPSDITGHSSVILSNGTMLVFGGYSQSQDLLFPFSTIWTLDTTASTLSWNQIFLSTNTLPNPRRAFASTSIEGNKVVIQGGSDASLQTAYHDGWILDLSQDSPSWVEVDALMQVGARYDHFAVPIGSSVMFGFGYGSSGPFATNILIYDYSSGTFASDFSLLSSSPGTTQTMPGSSQTSNPHPTGTGASPSSTGSVGVDPSSTTNSDPSDPTGGGGGGGTAPNGGDNANSDRTTAIALGTTFGVLGLTAGCVIIVYYVRHRKGNPSTGQRFMALHNDTEDGEDSPQHDRHLPLANGFGERRRHSRDTGWTILRSIGLAGVMPASVSARHNPERRDMLADEDAQDFASWYEKRWRDGTGSSWSLRSILGGGRRRSQEPSAASSLRVPWREKYDPFSDDTVLMGDVEPEVMNAGPSRPAARRQTSNVSTMSSNSFVDPFADPIHEDKPERYHDLDSMEDILEMPPPARFKLLPLSIQTVLPVSTISHALSPVTETSRLSIGDPSTPSIHTNSNSHEHNLSPFDSASGMTSRTSYDPSRSPGQRTSSLIASVPTQPMRRSDSWWARFSRTSLLDRRNSDASKRVSLDFRDPNPPPRLVAIEESTHSATSTSPEADNSTGFNRSSSVRPGSRRVSRVYGVHGKSSSSLRTADSELIERMVGTMDVAQRVRTGSHRTRESTGTRGDHPLVTSPSGMLSWDITRSSNDPPSRSLTPPLGSLILTSPSAVSPESGGAKQPLRRESVAARVQAYERRMSHDGELPDITLKEERAKHRSQVVDYGLVPRPSLFVANPDHRLASSGDS
ncbi:hypothetical protein F5146DRAFT_977040 [Armillaria mellea]|nr:hypothetical protein F5146DRAFT_977040 [Armillaria mellea]